MAKRKLTAVQTSGGRGTRSRPLSLLTPTSMMPKGLMRTMGLPIAEEQIEDFKGAGIKLVYMVTQYLENRESLSNRFGDGTRFGLKIHYSHPSDDEANNGNADAILTNIERNGLNGNSIWLANDNLYEYSHKRIVDAHRDLGAAVTILFTRVPPRETIKSYGLIDVDANHRVIRLFEKPKDEGEIARALKIRINDLDETRVLINTGGYVLDNDALTKISREKWVADGRKNQRNEFDMAGKFIKGLIERGYPVYAVPIDAWGDFGTTATFLDTFPQALSGMFPTIYKILEARGYYHDSSNNVWVHQESYNARDNRGRTLGQRMRSGKVKIGPNVFIGRDSRIGDGAEMSYSDLEKYATIGEGARLERVFLYPYCNIGPFAYVGDCALGFAVRVGSSKTSPAHVNGRSVVGPSIRIPKGTRLDGVVIDPGYTFRREGETHSHTTLRPTTQQLVEIVRSYR